MEKSRPFLCLLLVLGIGLPRVAAEPVESRDTSQHIEQQDSSNRESDEKSRRFAMKVKALSESKQKNPKDSAWIMNWLMENSLEQEKKNRKNSGDKSEEGTKK